MRYYGTILSFHMGVLAVLCLLLVILANGCATSLMAREPVQRSLVVPLDASHAYQYAAQTLAQFGASQIQGNESVGMLSSTVKGAIALNVVVRAEGQQSRIGVTGQFLPGKVVLGSLDEVDAYIALLQRGML